ncbi:TPA: SGNH/GDSL hydrolase family protein [Streptococcus suis]
MAYDFKSLTKQADEASNRGKFYTDFEDVDPNVLHQISDLTEWIRTKGKGADVREVIAQLFERTWLEATKEGNSNMEVAKARGEFDNLAQHLSSINANANTANKLAQSLDATKLDKKGIEQITYEMLTQDVKEKLTGGSVAVVGQNAVSTSNIVNGSVTDQKLDERMGFGLMIAGQLLIDVTNSKVELSNGSWFQVGKRKANITQTLTAPLPSTNLSQYIIYNDQTSELYVKNLNDITNIGNRETILAILYGGVLVHPQSSPFVKTAGLKVGERLDYINADWGTLIQGKITLDLETRTIRGQKTGDFIISYQNYYINGIEDFELTYPSSYGHLLLFDRETKKFQITTMNSYNEYKSAQIPKTASLIKIAEIYNGEIRHISSDSNIFLLNQKRQENDLITIEQLKIDLQTKRTVVVTLGDSTTDGYRTSSYSGNQLGSLTNKPNTWTEILNTIINNQKDYGFNHKFYNRGFSGKTIAWLKDNLDAVLAPIPEKIDYAFIAMGINDSVYDVSKIQAFKDNHINVINRLISKGIKPILMSTQAEFENYNRFGSKINSIADNIKKDLADELGIPFIDYNAGTRNILNNSEYSTKSLIPDMCHFGDLGHQKSAEFLAGQLIHQTVSIDKPTKIGYQNNKVVSDLNYSDHLTDVQKEVKWITRTDGFDLEGQLNASEAKTMFEVSVYIEQPMTVNYFGDNVTVTSNGQPLSDGATLDVGFYRITAKNQPNMVSKFRGLKFASKEV